jgi:hypothetical protein
MSVQLICCSHSPLMTTDVEESQPNVHAEFFRELDSCAAAVRAFNPDLLVVFGPDHFNGFFYELMPAFCIGTAAEGTNDWRLEGGPLRVPRELALSCIRHLQSRDFDVAISHQMKVDHGTTIPLFKLTGALARYSVLPIFVKLRGRSATLVSAGAPFRRSDRRVPGRSGHADHPCRLRGSLARPADAAARRQQAGRDAAPGRSRDADAGGL